eukprot:NODE_2923_length_725_cov_60.610947_g1929_i1.p3 GENE.NODE_2923_length_725_cov_60.610947_g1929_i1~~NODE_2923_length_725_cov_60.610947_g1929_i1.p3  ORF type:complete len:118 (-),score=6.88 NODE_2923_length_725_cov_60.610947_g1929_i1:21-374(-)
MRGGRLVDGIVVKKTTTTKKKKNNAGSKEKVDKQATRTLNGRNLTAEIQHGRQKGPHEGGGRIVSPPRSNEGRSPVGVWRLSVDGWRLTVGGWRSTVGGLRLLKTDRLPEGGGGQRR